MEKIVCFENYLSTRMDPRVREVICNEMENWLMPMQYIKQGAERMKTILRAKEDIASCIGGATSENVFFVPDGVFGNNLFVRGVVDYWRARGRKDIEIVVEKIACPDVLGVYKRLEKEGVKVRFVKVDKLGRVDMEDLKGKVSKRTVLVSVTHVNHVLGTVQPLKEIYSVVKERNAEAKVFVEAELSFMKFGLGSELCDGFVATGHKINGPVFGFLYVKSPDEIVGLLSGRGISKLEAGFPNIPYVKGLARAVELVRGVDFRGVGEIRNYLFESVVESIDRVKLLGPELDYDVRDPCNLCLSFEGVEGEAMYVDLAMRGVIVGTLSTCSHEKLEPNYVILEIGETHEVANGSLRFTLDKYVSKRDVDVLVRELKAVVERLRRMSPLA